MGVDSLEGAFAVDGVRCVIIWRETGEGTSESIRRRWLIKVKK